MKRTKIKPMGPARRYKVVPEQRAVRSGWQAFAALAGARARAPPLLLALARRCRRSSASVAQAAGLVDARRDEQLICLSRPAATSFCAARAVMIVLARACSPPGDGLSARRWHPELDASSIAPPSSREGPAVRRGAQLASAHCTRRRPWFEAAGSSPTLPPSSHSGTAVIPRAQLLLTIPPF